MGIRGEDIKPAGWDLIHGQQRKKRKMQSDSPNQDKIAKFAYYAFLGLCMSSMMFAGLSFLAIGPTLPLILSVHMFQEVAEWKKNREQKKADEQSVKWEQEMEAWRQSKAAKAAAPSSTTPPTARAP